MGSLLVLCSKTETGKNFSRGNFFYCRLSIAGKKNVNHLLLN